MPCYRPLLAYRARARNPSGKRGVSFTLADGYTNEPVELPCGRCIGCRLERSRQWAVRCVHEAKTHEENCFVTLTFSPEHLPPGGSVSVRDAQLFMKRLRKAIEPQRVRFFLCGEYGEQLGRPHYHALLFGFRPHDLRRWRMGDNPTYRSALLEQVWPFGQVEVGEVTFESAAYVARYITKKQTGDQAAAHYQGKHPEFIVMSRKPGIGTEWISRWKSDVYPSSLLVVRGVAQKPPAFYDRWLNKTHPKLWRKVRRTRMTSAETAKFNDFTAATPHPALSDSETHRQLTVEKALPRKLEHT